MPGIAASSERSNHQSAPTTVMIQSNLTFREDNDHLAQDGISKRLVAQAFLKNQLFNLSVVALVHAL